MQELATQLNRGENKIPSITLKYTTMMYRVKITHCAPIIENILGANYPYYLKDDHDLWIEVKSEEEASIIENIELHQTRTFQDVQELENLHNGFNHD